MKRVSPSANLTASDLARINSERGLQESDVTHIGEWADWPEAKEAQAAEAPDYNAMSRADALKLAEAAGMLVTGRTTKTEAVVVLTEAANSGGKADGNAHD